MSKKFVIMPDTTCDLSEKFMQEYDIEVILGHYTTPDGVEHTSIHNWGDLDRDEFYKAVKADPDGYTTAPPNAQECYLAFKKHVEKGEGVLAMAISTGISGTYAFMCEARLQVLKEFPDAEIYVIDSLRFGPGFGLMAIYASNLRKEGKSLKEVADWLEENKNCFHQTGWMDDLSFVAKKGRLTHAKAFFGTLVGVKPVGEFDYNGLTTVIGKAKGEKEAYKVLLEYIDRHIANPSEQMIFIATSNRHKNAEVFKQMIEERFHPKAVYVNDVFPNCGINIGPGLMAAYYFGKPISQGLVEEKATFEQILQIVRK